MRVRHTEPSLLSTVRGRRLLGGVTIVAAATLLGFLVAVRMYPAPLFPQNLALPRVLDIGITEAQERLRAAGFRLKIAPEEPDPRVPRGRVVWQDPPPGTLLADGSTVTLTPSAGPAQIPVPDLIGFDVIEAHKVILAAGFAVGEEDTVASGSDPGTVVATRPSAGSARDAGTPVDLILSSGPGRVTVPPVLGLPLAEARAALRGAGLQVGRVRRGDPSSAPGTVAQQNPAPGTSSLRDRPVDLVVFASEGT